MLYKKDWNSLYLPSEIFIREINEDGLSFSNETEPQIIFKATEVIELLVVEGQALIYREPYYYLIFSANWYNLPYYHASVARSEKVKSQLKH